MVSTVSLFGTPHKRERVKNNSTSLLVVSLGKTLKLVASIFRQSTRLKGQVQQKTSKRADEELVVPEAITKRHDKSRGTSEMATLKQMLTSC